MIWLAALCFLIFIWVLIELVSAIRTNTVYLSKINAELVRLRTER